MLLWRLQLALNGGRSSSSAAGSSTRKRGSGSGVRPDRFGGSLVNKRTESRPELGVRVGGVMVKALNLGSLRSSSASITGSGPRRLGAGWGSGVSTWIATRLSARGEKGAAAEVEAVAVTGVVCSGELIAVGRVDGLGEGSADAAGVVGVTDRDAAVRLASFCSCQRSRGVGLRKFPGFVREVSVVPAVDRARASCAAVVGRWMGRVAIGPDAVGSGLGLGAIPGAGLVGRGAGLSPVAGLGVEERMSALDPAAGTLRNGSTG